MVEKEKYPVVEDFFLNYSSIQFLILCENRVEFSRFAFNVDGIFVFVAPRYISILFFINIYFIYFNLSTFILNVIFKRLFLTLIN